MRIQRLSTEPFKGKVYNIATRPNHNYFANGVLVHNCYQGSSPNKPHGSIPNFVHEWLLEGKVFEVAIGGGEPTLHPEFSSILYNMSWHGIVPNFTTYSLSWMLDSNIVKAVKECVGRFAISIDSPNKIKDAIKAAEHCGIRDKISFHYVLGSQPDYMLYSILHELGHSGITIVLLGFKNTGRGKSFKKEPYGDWIKTAKESNARIGIDTALANEYKDQLEKAGVNHRFVTYREGVSSMYIDCSSEIVKVGPSSYCDEKDYINVKNKDELTSAFAQWK